jgi:cephalosporin hydroxylase
MTTLDRPSVALPKNPVPRQQYRFFPTFADREHPTRWEFPGYLDNPGCRWLQCLKEMYALPIIFPSSLSPEAGLMLHALVRNMRPRVVIEVGTFLSVSTHWIASALIANGDGGVIHCFDDFGPVHRGPWRDAEMLEGRLDWIKDRLTMAGLLDVVRFHPGDSSTQLIAEREGLASSGGVDLAFIDGDHSVPGACNDLWAVEPVLNTGGYVLLHDTYPELCGDHAGPRHILDTINVITQGCYEKCELNLSPLNYGMGLLRRVG